MGVTVCFYAKPHAAPKKHEAAETLRNPAPEVQVAGRTIGILKVLALDRQTLRSGDCSHGVTPDMLLIRFRPASGLISGTAMCQTKVANETTLCCPIWALRFPDLIHGVTPVYERHSHLTELISPSVMVTVAKNSRL